MNTERVPFPTSNDMSSPGADVAGMPDDNGSTSSTGPRGDLLGRVVSTAHETIDRLADRAAPHVARLEGGMHDAGDMLHERTDQMRDIGSEWVDSVRTSVREHPMAAVGLALALGMVVARLSRR
jgi:ElaB/YqjD/DUF883 family membrane-anchored ribosome-binding protein